MEYFLYANALQKSTPQPSIKKQLVVAAGDPDVFPLGTISVAGISHFKEASLPELTGVLLRATGLSLEMGKFGLISVNPLGPLPLLKSLARTVIFHTQDVSIFCLFCVRERKVLGVITLQSRCPHPRYFIYSQLKKSSRNTKVKLSEAASMRNNPATETVI